MYADLNSKNPVTLSINSLFGIYSFGLYRATVYRILNNIFFSWVLHLAWNFAIIGSNLYSHRGVEINEPQKFNIFFNYFNNYYYFFVIILLLILNLMPIFSVNFRNKFGIIK